MRRLVFLSSIKVNGERTTNDRPKLKAEEILGRPARDTHLETSVLRTSLIHGPEVKGNLARMIQLLGRGLPVPREAVHNKRSMIARESLVSALLVLTTHPRTVGQTFLISDQVDLSVAELVAALAKGLDRHPRLLPVPPSLLDLAGRLVGRPEILQRLVGSLRVDSSKLTAETGWRPLVTPEAGLAATAKHYRTMRRGQASSAALAPPASPRQAVSSVPRPSESRRWSISGVRGNHPWKWSMSLEGSHPRRRTGHAYLGRDRHQAQTDDRDRWKADPLAHHEDLRRARDQ